MSGKIILPNKKPNYDKLITYGFQKQDNVYTFNTTIMNGDFQLIVLIMKEEISYRVIDTATNDDYAPVYLSDVSGQFIGQVRAECERVLNDVMDICFEPNVFKSPISQAVIQYILHKYNVNAEFLWEKLPNHAAFREKGSQKWFALISTVKKRTIGIDEIGMVEILNLKETPENIAKLVNGTTYLSGYHMNKKHWYTIKLDNSVAIDEIYHHIDISYGFLKK